MLDGINILYGRETTAGFPNARPNSIVGGNSDVFIKINGKTNMVLLTPPLEVSHI
jgi:hypothetical protein